MRIKKHVLDKIRQSAKIKRELIYHLEVSEATIYRYIAANKPNGDLVVLKALQIISKELNIPVDELIEEDKISV